MYVADGEVVACVEKFRKSILKFSQHGGIGVRAIGVFLKDWAVFLHRGIYIFHYIVLIKAGVVVHGNAKFFLI